MLFRVELTDPAMSTVSTIELVWKVSSLDSIDNTTIEYRRYRHNRQEPWTSLTKYHDTNSQVRFYHIYSSFKFSLEVVCGGSGIQSLVDKSESEYRLSGEASKVNRLFS